MDHKSLAQNTAPSAALQPWALSRTPNYAAAIAVESISAENISEEEFFSRYVRMNRPCLLVGAAKHWPAVSNWDSVSYLKNEIPNTTINARSAPVSEYAHMADEEIKNELHARNVAAFNPIPIHDFLDVANSTSGQLVLHSLSLMPGEPLGVLHKDLGWYKFLPEWKGSRMYPRFRAFFYRNSYTDWHFHPTDEALMTQVVGAKEVLLLPPDDATWKALYPVACKTGYLYGVDDELFPQIRQIRPRKTLVRPGDALYIPVFWWHAVESVDDKFGITVASTFKSPVQVNGDLRYPAARYLMKRFLRTRFAPMMLLGVAYAYLHRLVCGLLPGGGEGRRRV